MIRYRVNFRNAALRQTRDQPDRRRLALSFELGKVRLLLALVRQKHKEAMIRPEFRIELKHPYSRLAIL